MFLSALPIEAVMTKSFFYLYLTSFLLGLALSPQKGLAKDSLQDLKAKAIKRLKARKKGFDAYQKKLEEFEKKRWADADKMKDIRKAYAEKQEKARRAFVRRQRVISKEAYQEFIAKREIHRAKRLKARESFSYIRKELNKVKKDKRYRISGKKEFNL
jgi:ABC-type multidrug transport system fused ATPase/permease subunit